MAKRRALRVAILWHMHQPNYHEPGSGRLAMPWVRLHALKDYLDMPLAATRYENIRVTFNLVPSLIDQLQLYLEGGTDRHLELSRLPAAELSRSLKSEILQTFFMANPERMIAPYQRYAELHRKQVAGVGEPETLVGLFSSEEMRDLQVWSNLVWVDPAFRSEEPIRSLFAKGRHFTETDKVVFFEWQHNLINRIVPAYQKLMAEDRLEVSFTPYYHPILPLLCDTDSAREALPSITLPNRRFAFPEDARWQMAQAILKYRELFGRDPLGMWPSEGSVSEPVVQLAAELGLKWLASDEEVLAHSLAKGALSPRSHPLHQVYEHPSQLKLLFRDHALSDRIGFVYSTWDASKAVADFMAHLTDLRHLYADQLDRVVVPIILDGENAWEYFPDDGTEFLDLLYSTLASDPEIETITMGEAATGIEAKPLPQIFAGSWINHNFRIWIGHSEDNAAWDLLSQTRSDLVKFVADHPDADQDMLSRAWRQIYIAEGSDWCWWYGDEHRTGQADEFDQIFRRHLVAVYEILGLDVPAEHRHPIHSGGELLKIVLPDGLVTPEIDGLLTHFYEWAGAGYYECKRQNGAMHAVQQYCSGLYFAYDHDRFHIRLDFRSINSVESMAGIKVAVSLYSPQLHQFSFCLADNETAGHGYRFALKDVLEFTVERDLLWPEGWGVVELSVTLMQDNQQLEVWPEHKPLRLEVPRRNEEMFWPT